jgi:hypothetical protein
MIYACKRRKYMTCSSMPSLHVVNRTIIPQNWDTSWNIITLLANMHKWNLKLDNHMLTNWTKECKLKIRKNKKKQKEIFYLVLIGVFNFLGFRPTLLQAFVHSYLLFLNFFCHVIHFYKFVWVDFMETYLKLLQTLWFSITCWQALKKACFIYI